jgi:hypothetical protein
MKGGKRTSKGRIINIDDLIASAPHTTAVGNMRVNAQGDTLGSGGEVIQTREQRTRAYYKNHPQSSNKKVSLKGEMNEAFADSPDANMMMAPSTSKTGAENVRTSQVVETSEDVVAAAPDLASEELEEFNDVELPPDDAPAYEIEPDGFEEVHLPNGDIEMRPFWNTTDEPTDPDTGSKLA